MNYNKEKAITELKEGIGWRAYGRKHGESLFTKFFQNYYLPMKFNYDKRKPHLSSLIVSGQMNREDALLVLQEPLYSHDELEVDINYFCKKLQIKKSDFDGLMKAPIHHYKEFSNWNRRYQILKKLQKVIETLTGKRNNRYS